MYIHGYMWTATHGRHIVIHRNIYCHTYRDSEFNNFVGYCNDILNVVCMSSEVLSLLVYPILALDDVEFFLGCETAVSHV